MLFLSVLLVFGLLIGLYIALSNIEILREEDTYYVSHIENRTYNHVFFHFFILVIGTILSFFAIGIPFLCALLFYEGMSIGFVLGIFGAVYHSGGLIFALIFLLITKAFYLFNLLFLFTKCLKISCKMIGKYIYKTDPSILVKHFMKGCVLITLFVLLYDLFLWGFGDQILPLFKFLIP